MQKWKMAEINERIQMESIKIPRLSYLNSEYDVFYDVITFVELSERLCKKRGGSGNNTAPVSVLKELSDLHKRPVGDLQRLFFAVRDAAFAYRIPEDNPVSKKSPPLFPDDSLAKWRKWKCQLKRLIKQHREPLFEVKQCQEKSWKSRDKVHQYANMLEAARLSLPNYVDDIDEHRIRSGAIKCLSRDLQSRQRRHIRNLNNYQTLLNQESIIREQIGQIAESLETEIKRRIKAKLEEGYTNLLSASDETRCSLSLDIEKICDKLYSVTCKNYLYNLPAADVSSAEFNVPLKMPHVEDSVYTYGDINATYASHNYFGTVVTETDQLGDYCLPLRLGDQVKLKMVSRDQLLGFGWMKTSKLSMKKWGFFPVLNLQLYAGQDSNI